MRRVARTAILIPSIAALALGPLAEAATTMNSIRIARPMDVRP